MHKSSSLELVLGDRYTTFILALLGICNFSEYVLRCIKVIQVLRDLD